MRRMNCFSACRYVCDSPSTTVYVLINVSIGSVAQQLQKTLDNQMVLR